MNGWIDGLVSFGLGCHGYRIFQGSSYLFWKLGDLLDLLPGFGLELGVGNDFGDQVPLVGFLGGQDAIEDEHLGRLQ